LSFEGVAGTFRLGWGDGGADRSHVYATLGGFPILEIPLFNSENKWLVGGQLGTNLRFNDGADHLRIGAAYYDFMHVTGIRNSPDSTLQNFTAPAFVRYGNDLFDISNISDLDQSANLFGLASHFRLVDIAGNYEHGFGRYSLAFTAEGVRNIGFNLNEVNALLPTPLPGKENTGYVGEVSFGRPVVDEFNKWRIALGYRYVKRDAVLDAWTDADFHEGGTNAEGFYVWGSYGLAKNTWVRVRYMSSNEIDGPRYGLDILQVDINARF
ncbi:MAG TPA: putative porin, partial [Steroidobacteraceae bacterium]